MQVTKVMSVRASLLFLLLTVLSAATPRAHAASDSTAVRRSYPSWVPNAAGAAAGAVINIAAVEILKHTVDMTRPDGKEHTFPSRHAAWASMAATIAAHELYRHSPWWVLGAHAVTVGVGVQRVATSNHYPRDVAMGYAMGLASVQAGYALSRLVFGGSHAVSGYTNSFSQSIDMVTRVVFPFGYGHSDGPSSTSLATTVRAVVGESRWAYHMGVTVGSMMAEGYYENGGYNGRPLTSVGLETGALWRVNPGQSPWAASAILSAGVLANIGPHHEPGISFKLGLEGECSYRLTPGLSLGATVGSGVITLDEVHPFVSVGFLTRVCF